MLISDKELAELAKREWVKHEFSEAFDHIATTLRTALLDSLAAQAGDVEKSGLLPCPFCGESPTKSTYQDESLWNHNIVDWHVISCPDCEIDIRQCDGDDEITTRWNSRAISAPLLAQVEGLKAENERLKEINSVLLAEIYPPNGTAAIADWGVLKARAEAAEFASRSADRELVRLASEKEAAEQDCDQLKARVEELERRAWDYARDLEESDKAQGALKLRIAELEDAILIIHAGDNWVAQYSDNPGVCVCAVCEPIRDARATAALEERKGHGQQGQKVCEWEMYSDEHRVHYYEASCGLTQISMSERTQGRVCPKCGLPISVKEVG